MPISEPDGPSRTDRETEAAQTTDVGTKGGSHDRRAAVIRGRSFVSKHRTCSLPTGVTTSVTWPGACNTQPRRALNK